MIHGENGFEICSDEEFIETLSAIVKVREKLKVMGKMSCEMTKGWGWDKVAPMWKFQIKNFLEPEGLTI